MNPKLRTEDHLAQNSATVKNFDYSDGDEIESQLLSAVKSLQDLSLASAELAQYIKNWPSKYHLSSSRHNLLRPVNFAKDSRILELGCGCGALTRYFGESGANVVAVEGSARRAEITAQRCRDLRNVSVVCNNLMDFRTNQRFDVVTLIGVLEYAPRYISAGDPIDACLKQASSFLKPDGVLLLAIENQLGLKYFNGCNEDHIGKAYYGLHNLYQQDEPTTLGRSLLEKKLSAAGVPHHYFYYPFPDYKLPQIILSETALSTPGFDSAALLSRMASRNAEDEFHPNFHEHLAWRPIIENGLMPHLTNSFFVIAGSNESALSKRDSDFLAAAYAPDRRSGYATETIFRKPPPREVIVEKNLLFPEHAMASSFTTIAGGKLLHHVNTVCNYVPGSLYIVELQQRLARGEGLDAVTTWARDWLELVKSELSEDMTKLSGDWLDKIPQNFIRTAEGQLASIDTEWALSQPLPANWIITRGLMNALAVCSTSPALNEMTLLETLRYISASAGLQLDKASILKACSHEAELRSIVFGENLDTVQQRLLQDLYTPPRALITGPTNREKFVALENELRRIKSTISWQATKPLRLIANLPSLIKTWLQ